MTDRDVPNQISDLASKVVEAADQDRQRADRLLAQLAEIGKEICPACQARELARFKHTLGVS